MKKTLQDVYKKYKIILFPVLVGIAGIILVAFVIIPQFNEYTKGQEELTAARDRIALLDGKVKGLQALSSLNINDKVLVAVSAFPPEKDYPGIIGLVQRITTEHGLTLGSLQISQGGGAGAKGAAPHFTVRFEVNGPKQSFNEMLGKIEKSYRVVKVATLDIASNSESEITSTVTIESFYEPTPNALGAVDAPLATLTPEDEEILANLSAVAPSTVAEEDVSSLPRGKSNPFE